MKQKVNKLSKRNKIIAIIVAILLACCITVSGIMLFKGQKSAPANAASPNTSVTIVTKDKDGNETTQFEAGDTIYFSVTVTTSRSNVNWYALSCIIAPVTSNSKTDRTILPSLSFPDGYVFEPSAQMDTDFNLRTYTETVGTGRLWTVDEESGNIIPGDGVPLGLGVLRTTGYTNTSTVNSITYDFPLILSENFTGTEITFGVEDNAGNSVNFMQGNDTTTVAANTDNMEVGTMACTPITITIGGGGGGGSTNPPSGTKDNDTSINPPTATSGGTNIPLTPTSDGKGFTGSVSDINGKVTINVTPNSSTTHVTSGGGEVDLSNVPTNPDGSKTVSVTVEAEDGSTETYTFTFSKPKSSSYNITVTASATGVSSSPWSTPGNYTFTVPYDTTSATLTANATSPITVASGSQTGTKTNLQVGNNGPYKIWGVAEDGTNSTGASAFYITIVRQQAPSSNTFDMTVSVSANGSSYGSWSTPNSYTCYVPYDAYTATVSANAQSPATVASGSEIGTKSLNVGENGPYKVWAVAQDGTNSDGASAFYITIVRRDLAETAPLLAEILIDNYDDGNSYLVKNFDPNDMGVYKVYVPSDATHPRITANAQDQLAEITMKVNGYIKDQNTGSATDVASLLEIGSSATVEITVSLDGKSSTYTLMLIRSSEEPYLTYLTVGNYQIFDGNGKAVNGKDENAVRDVYDFYVTIENADTNVNIFARASEEDVEVKIASKQGGTSIIEIGECDFTASVSSLFGTSAHADVQITIYPQFGETIIHNIHLTRKPALSNNTNAGITIDEITEQYNATIFNNEYAANNYKLIYGKPYRVPYNAAVLTITVNVENLGEMVAPATYEILYNDVVQRDANGKVYGNVQLNYDCNVVTINIIASDGSQRPVTVHVERELPYLFSASISEIPEFANEYKTDCTDYAYEVGHDVSKLTILANYDQNLYNCVISGNDNLKNGLNVITICLYEKNSGIGRTAASTDVGDAVRTITIDVFRDSAGNISTIWLILFIIFLILAIIEAIIVAALLTRRRNDTTTQRIVVASAPAPAPAPVPVPAPAPVVRVQPQVQYVPVPQPQVQYVSVPQPQPVEVEKPQQPVNVEVKITGCGDSDGYYKTRK